MLSVKWAFQKSLPGFERLPFVPPSFVWPVWQSNLIPEVTGGQLRWSQFLAVNLQFQGRIIPLTLWADWLFIVRGNFFELLSSLICCENCPILESNLKTFKFLNAYWTALFTPACVLRVRLSRSSNHRKVGGSNPSLIVLCDCD